MCATTRLRHSGIRRLSVDGTVITGHDGKAQILHSYYSSLLGSPATTCCPLPNLVDLMDTGRLYSNEAHALAQPFTEADIRSALCSMRVDSAPGPDGFGPKFFPENWNLLKMDIMQFIQDFQAGRAGLRGINQVYIALLPKKPDAQHP